ncbi:hypothetical protein HanPSC8_Chr08g0317071 [Helianthus annuus]|nr:hypothetical protein HanPSC8_Chr08g0317071 [Helianthus annuus]
MLGATCPNITSFRTFQTHHMTTCTMAFSTFFFFLQGDPTPLSHDKPDGLGEMARNEKMFTGLFIITTQNTSGIVNNNVPASQCNFCRETVRYSPPRDNTNLLRHIVIPNKNICWD